MSKKYVVKNSTAVEVSEELHEYLTQSDRRIRYIEKDLKRNRYKIDMKKETVTVISSREDSLERLMDIGKDYPAPSSDVGWSTIEKIMLEQALEKLNEKERYLIVQLFYRKPAVQTNPQSIKTVMVTEYEPTDEIRRMTNEINRLIDSEASDKENIEALIIKCAQLKYAAIDEVRT